jgi:hypothetical protein
VSSKERVQSLEAQEKLVEKDLYMLLQYMEDDTVTRDTDAEIAVYEPNPASCDGLY